MRTYTESVSGTIAAGGTLTLKFAQVPFASKKRSYVRVTSQLSTGEASLGGSVAIYSTASTVAPYYVDGSSTPWGDTATFSPGQAEVHPGQQLTAVYAACDPGAIATLTATYQVED